MNGALVVINGYPGVGKTVIAHELLRLIPNSTLVDVRHLDKLAAGIHPEGSPENMNLRRALRQTTLKSLVPSETNRIRSPANGHAQDSSTAHLCPPIYIFPESLYSTTHTHLLDIKPQFCKAFDFTLLSVIIPLDTESHVARAKLKGYTEDHILEVRMCEEVGYFNTPRDRVCQEFEVITEGLSPERAGTRVAEYILDALRTAGWFIQFNRPKR